MANSNAPFGARFIGSLQRGVVTGGLSVYSVPATDSTAIFIGDFVTQQGTGVTGVNGQVNPTVAQSAAADKVTGVVIGFDPSRTYENQLYRTASTLRDVYVLDDPYAEFEIQASGTFTVTMIGSNADIVVNAGDTATGVSGMALDVTTVANTATLPLRITGISRQIKNEVGDYTILKCIMNYNAWKNTTGLAV